MMEPAKFDPPLHDGPLPAVGAPRQYLYLALGWLFVGLAYLGAVLPVLPTTPFLLLASYFFARSSPRLHQWLRRTPYFGSLIHDWETHRGIRSRVKATAVTLIVVVVGSTILFSPIPTWGRWSAGGLAAFGIAVILFAVPTLRRTQDTEIRKEPEA